ncbi:lysozyme inhibitor LprI family protein [Helicobacter typhlonius]|uniref:lysozyme inhibitor LprI family protein n=2 Tax=Helicobacter typhlonius TaxID=76936 RepID=UPI002FE005F2
MLYKNIFKILFFIAVLISLVNAQSSEMAKPSFDCAKVTTKVEKMICEDSSGELQNLDRQIFKSYQETKAKLDKNGKKAFLDSQKSWLKTRERCESKECLKEVLQHRIKELQRYTPHTSNAWLGTYELRKNLYYGSFEIQKCDTNNICEASYFALLHKSEFNDMHQCDISLKLQIKSQQEAIAYYDDEDFVNCKIYIKKNPQGIVFTRDEKAFDSPDSFCSTMCGNQTIFQWGDVYKKEVQ